MLSWISTIRKKATNFIAQVYYRFNVLFSKQKDIVFVWQAQSKSFGNIPVIIQQLKERKIPYKVIDGRFSSENIKVISRATVLCVDQTNQLTSRLKLIEKTRTVQLWHAGGAFKRIAFDAWDGSHKDLKRINRVHGNTDFLIVSDAKLVSLLANAFHIQSSHVLPLGLARSDVAPPLSNSKTEPKNLILLAPTFRTDVAGRRYLNYLEDEVKFLQVEAKRNGYDLALRLHPSVKSFHIDGILDVSNEELYSCLSKTAILITDFSSIIFDYSLFDGKVFWWLKDYDLYEIERGLYFDPSIVYPEYSAQTVEALIPKIFNSNKPINTPELRKNFMSACDGKSCDRITQFLINLSSEVK